MDSFAAREVIAFLRKSGGILIEDRKEKKTKRSNRGAHIFGTMGGLLSESKNTGIQNNLMSYSYSSITGREASLETSVEDEEIGLTDGVQFRREPDDESLGITKSMAYQKDRMTANGRKVRETKL